MYYTHPKNLGPALKIDILGDKRGISRTILQLDDQPGLKWSIEGDNETIHRWLLSYVEKKPRKFPPLEFPSVTLFTERVWRKMLEIPFGETRTYGEVAQMVGHPQAPRAVGSACRKNVLMLFVPCHRVLSSSGIVCRTDDGEIRRRLLEFEINT